MLLASAPNLTVFTLLRIAQGLCMDVASVAPFPPRIHQRCPGKIKSREEIKVARQAEVVCNRCGD
jgi:hypothetical protein